MRSPPAVPCKVLPSTIWGVVGVIGVETGWVAGGVTGGDGEPTGVSVVVDVVAPDGVVEAEALPLLEVAPGVKLDWWLLLVSPVGEVALAPLLEPAPSLSTNEVELLELLELLAKEGLKCLGLSIGIHHKE